MTSKQTYRFNNRWDIVLSDPSKYSLVDELIQANKSISSATISGVSDCPVRVHSEDFCANDLCYFPKNLPKGNSFRAACLGNLGHGASALFKGILWDKNLEIICETSPNIKKIVDVFELHDPEQIKDLDELFFYPIGTSFRAHHRYYFGEFPDALAEFVERGYTINLWPVEWSINLLDCGKETKGLKSLYGDVSPQRNVSIKEILDKCIEF